MFIDNLIEARVKAGNPSFKDIAAKAHCSALTVSSIFNRKNEFPDTYTLDKIAKALNTTLEKILSGTEASVGDVKPLEDEISSLTAEVEKLKAELTLLRTEIAHKDEVIAHKDEVIACKDGVIALKDEIIGIYKTHTN